MVYARSLINPPAPPGPPSITQTLPLAEAAPVINTQFFFQKSYLYTLVQFSAKTQLSRSCNLFLFIQRKDTRFHVKLGISTDKLNKIE